MAEQDDDTPIEPAPHPPQGPGGVWPKDRPFPLTPEECERLVRGYPVPWRGSLDDFLLLPGKYEMIDGWIHLWRA